MIRRAPLLACALAWLAIGCDDSVVVELRSGAQGIELGADELGIPGALRDESTGEARIASIACDASAPCVAGEIVCEAGLCDPSPRTLAIAAGDVVDLDALTAEVRSLVRQIESIEVVDVQCTIAENTLTVGLPELEILWGPEDAAPGDPALGVLGTVPAIAPRSTEPRVAELDPDGVASLSAYLVGTSRRARFFVRGQVDLDPGGAFPEGRIGASIDLAVRITGSVVR